MDDVIKKQRVGRFADAPFLWSLFWIQERFIDALQSLFNTKTAVGLVLATWGSLFLPCSCKAEELGPETGIDWALTANDISTRCALELHNVRAELSKIKARARVTNFAAGLGAIEEAVARMQDNLSAEVVLSQLSTEQTVRDASTECYNAVQAFTVELSADPHVYALAKAAQGVAVTPEGHQLAKIYVENGQRAGASLDSSRRASVIKLLNEINTLQVDFGRALAEDKSQILLSDEDLGSLPESLNGSLTQLAHGAHLPVNESTVTPFLENESIGAVREEFLTVFDRLGGTENVKRLRRAVILRKRAASLLGFQSWAAYQLNVKMAKTPQNAEDLILQVDRALLAKAQNEIEELSALKTAHGDNSPFMRWDYRFYEQLLQRTRYAVDADRVRQYFPVDKVVPAVLDVYAHLFGVHFQHLQPAKAWAPQITEYAIYDADSGDPIGWFYLDLYPRYGKYNHFAAFPLRAGRLLQDGRYRKPVAAIIGNWPAPATGKPTLLSYPELVTFFHEFGHIMHETLSRTHYASLFGPNTRGDFPEAPSQMLENWMSRPEVLKKISSHVITGEPLPDDLIEKLIALKHVDDGMYWCRQVLFGVYDLRLHGPQPPADPTRLFFDLSTELLPLPPIPGTYPEASFIHVMSGLDAGYYGYIWSRIYAQDMYSVFEREGVDNPAVGKRYRDVILGPGGAEEADVLVQRFLQRPVSLQPLYEDLGIAGHPHN